MKKHFVILLSLINLSVYSQDLDWRYKIGGSYEDKCYDIEIDSSNNFYLTGGFCNAVNFDLKGNSYNVSAYGTDKSDIFIAKYNTNQELIYAFGLKGSSWDYATDIEVDNMGSTYISGFYEGTINMDPTHVEHNLSSSNSMYFIAKYDSSGSFIWAKNICRKKDNSGPIRSKMFSDRNSNMYVSTPDTLIKINSNGTIKWAIKTSGFAVYDNNSSFYILSNSLTPWDDNKYGKLTLIKIDTSGYERFSKDIITCSDEISINGFLTYDKSGNLLINGDYWGDCIFQGNTNNITLNNHDIGCCPRGPGTGCFDCPSYNEYFAKFDTTGNVIWTYDFGNNGPNPYIIETTNTGTIFMSGFLNFSADFDHTENFALLTNSGCGDYIAKYDPFCNFLGATEFMGGSYNDFLGGFKLFNDSTAYICGHFFNTINLDLNGSLSELYASPPEDIFIAKYSDFDISDYTTTKINEFGLISDVIVFPNPTHRYLNIRQRVNAIDEVTIQNMNGQSVIISNKYIENPIDIGFLPNGLYLITIKSKNEIFIKKLVKY